MNFYNFNLRAPVGQLLQEARESKKITQREVAETAGITINHISRIEHGVYNTSIDVLISYSKVLKMSPDEILGYSEPLFDSDSAELLHIIKKLKPHQIKYLLELSKDLARLNHYD